MTVHVHSLLEYENSSVFSAIFTRENCFLDILFTFPELEALPTELYSYNTEFALAIERNEKKVKLRLVELPPLKCNQQPYGEEAHAMPFLFYFIYFYFCRFKKRGTTTNL